VGAALRPLAENVPKLVIHMDIQQPLTVDDPERAHVLLRCAQEAITNAVRHADARNLWLQAHADGHRILLNVRDDGSGADEFTNGNGLHGMRERLRQLGGRLEIRTRAGDGFQLTMTLPAGATDQPGIPEGVTA
jgi:signal transduction histidine kinase